VGKSARAVVRSMLCAPALLHRDLVEEVRPPSPNPHPNPNPNPKPKPDPDPNPNPKSNPNPHQVLGDDASQILPAARFGELEPLIPCLLQWVNR